VKAPSNISRYASRGSVPVRRIIKAPSRKATTIENVTGLARA
jgi:hypothetical protein